MLVLRRVGELILEEKKYHIFLTESSGGRVIPSDVYKVLKKRESGPWDFYKLGMTSFTELKMKPNPPN